jgi:Anti-sigma-K factor rskA
MEHVEARELLETAAVEPGGFERLMAGDTAEASALAGHLAGCPACAADMERLRRDSTVIRSVVRSLPPPDLRERTLAFVAAVGRERGTGAVGPAGAVAAGAVAAPIELAPDRAVAGPGSGAGRLGRVLPWAASLAAVLIVAVAGTSLLVGGSRDRVINEQSAQIGALSKIATYTLRIDGQPDATHVELASTSGSDATASLLFSRATGELVILAEGLTPAPTGQEYRCWMEVDGRRTRIGRMFFAGDVAFWVGEVPTLGAADDAAEFGVTLVPADGESVDGDPVLQGGV